MTEAEYSYDQIKAWIILKEANPIILQTLLNGGRVIFKIEKGSMIIRVTEKPEVVKKIDKLTKIGDEEKERM